jgi:hypothetical protein
MGWTTFYVVSALGAVPGILLLPRFAPWVGTRSKAVVTEPVGQ